MSIEQMRAEVANLYPGESRKRRVRDITADSLEALARDVLTKI